MRRRGEPMRGGRTWPTLLVVLLLAAGCTATGTPDRTTGTPDRTTGSGVSAAPSPTAAPTPAATPASTRTPVRASPTPVALTPSPRPTPGPTPSLSPPPTPRPERTVPPELAAELQAVLDATREKQAIPGVQVAVLWPDGRLWVGTSGLADLGARQPVTPDTLFAVGSITKTFVAALVLQLAAEGRLGLDDPLSRWLPAFPNAERISVRQLLGHTSGVRDFFENATLLRALDADRGRAWTAAEVLRYVGGPYFAPGADYRYSNTNYVLLGLVVEGVTGRSVAEEVRRRFLAPLELRSTYLQTGERPVSGPRAHGYAGTKTAPRDVGDGSRYLPFTSLATAVGTAGAIVSTAEDLARWADALYRGRVLPAGALVEMLDFQPRPKYHYAYGLGALSSRVGILEAWGHGGRLSGFTASVRYFPRARLTIAVLTNQERVNSDVVVAAFLEEVPRYGPKRRAGP